MRLTKEAYKEQGIVSLGRSKVMDAQGREYYPKKVKSPAVAIKMFCRECMGMDRRKKKTKEGFDLVRDCTDPMCPLFDFRFGRNPHNKRTLTEKQKKDASERMRKGRDDQLLKTNKKK